MGSRDIVRQRKRPGGASGILSDDIAVRQLRDELAAALGRIAILERGDYTDPADKVDEEQARIKLDTVVDDARIMSRKLEIVRDTLLSNSANITDIFTKLDQLGWEFAENVDTVELDAFGAVEGIGRNSLGTLQVQKITTDNLSPGLVRFVGDIPIAVGGFSLVSCPFMTECKAPYSGAAPSVGDILTTEAGSFDLIAGDETTPGFVVTGTITETIGELGTVSRATVLPYAAGGGSTAESTQVQVKIVSGSGANYVITVHENGWSEPATGVGTLYVGWMHASAILDAGLELMALETSTPGAYETSIPLWL